MKTKSTFSLLACCCSVLIARVSGLDRTASGCSRSRWARPEHFLPSPNGWGEH